MKSKRTPISQVEVLDWLKTHHPTLFAVAEVDRAWVWLPVDLRSDHATRESIKAYGFAFAKHGGHLLSSGKKGTWGHSCTAPLPFFRGKGRKTSAAAATPTAESATPTSDDAEAMAFAGMA